MCLLGVDDNGEARRVLCALSVACNKGKTNSGRRAMENRCMSRLTDNYRVLVKIRPDLALRRCYQMQDVLKMFVPGGRCLARCTFA